MPIEIGRLHQAHDHGRALAGSVAGLALSHGLNPNMVHRCIREERQRQAMGRVDDGRSLCFYG